MENFFFIDKTIIPRMISDHFPVILDAKVFASRLKKELPTTIEETQSVFIERRQILDCCLLANEVVENLSGKKKKGWVFKVDFEKAYDNVDRGFLDYLLLKKGFGERWRKWIWGCIFKSY